MNNTKRCAACRQEKPVSEMKVCMHNQMHRYVCDMKCMNDFYNPPKKTAPEAEPVASVAYLDVGAGGYVDLGTDQPIEALEKMPYGRHMLGIIGTYGADGWKPSPSQPATKSEPVAYAAFSDNGNIRVWSRALNVIEIMAAQGCKAVPLYTAPQHDAGWREHSKQYAKGEKCPETIETLQAAWDRDQELMMDQKAEISRLKEKLNRAEQRNKPHDAELVELLELVVDRLRKAQIFDLSTQVCAKLATLSAKA